MTPLTIADAPQATLDAIMRTGLIDVGPDALGRSRPLVDVGHIWVLFDRGLNGLGWKGHGFDVVTDPTGALSWTGDLGSWWIEYNDARQAARQAVLAAGGTWSEPTTTAALATPLGWLQAATTKRCSAEDLLGDMDAIILSQEAVKASPSDPTPLSSLIASYYFPDTLINTGNKRARVHSDNRFHLFVQRALPPIPHTTDPTTKDVSLADSAEATIRSHIKDAAFWLLFVARAKKRGLLDWSSRIKTPLISGGLAHIVRKSVLEDLESLWGEKMFDRIAADFTAFLRDGLAGDGWTLSGWPTLPSALDEYGAKILKIGDQDSSTSGPIRQLQKRLNDLGFTIVGTPDGVFGPRTAVALRELQIAASYDSIHARTEPGPLDSYAVHDALRRYIGPIHGVLDAETAETINVWSNPRQYWPNAPFDRIFNPLRIQARQMNANVLNAISDDDVWAHDEVTTDGLRFFAVDQLERYDIPESEHLTAEPGMAILGRYTASYLGGPVVDNNPPKSIWNSAKIRLSNLVPVPFDPINLPIRSQYRVIRAVAEVECLGHYDSINCYDKARLSAGMYHWALQGAYDGKVAVGELAAFLACYKDYDANAYWQDFGRFGIEPETAWDPAAWNSDGAHSQAKFAGRLAMYGLHDAVGAVYPYQLRPLGEINSNGIPQGVLSEDAYLVDYLRSWRSLHRLLMALRLSPALHHAQWYYALLRLRTLLNRPWTTGSLNDAPVIQEASGLRAATFGEIFTSEKAVAVLLRWHVNRPGRVIESSGATEDVLTAYQNVFGSGQVNLSAITEPLATQRQTELVDQLVTLAPTLGGFQTSVSQVRDYVDVEAGALQDAAGSFYMP